MTPFTPQSMSSDSFAQLIAILEQQTQALVEVPATLREMQIEIRHMRDTLANQAGLSERVTRIEERTQALDTQADRLRLTLQWAVGLGGTSVLGIVGIILTLLSRHS